MVGRAPALSQLRTWTEENRHLALPPLRDLPVHHVPNADRLDGPTTARSRPTASSRRGPMTPPRDTGDAGAPAAQRRRRRRHEPVPGQSPNGHQGIAQARERQARA